MTIIEKIKTEIERRLKNGEKKILLGESNPYWDYAVMSTLANLLSFISTLESENPIGLEEEIHKYNKERFDEYFPEQDGDFISEVDFMTCLDRVACHFAQWGAEHFRNTTKMISGSSEIQKELDEDGKIL